MRPFPAIAGKYTQDAGGTTEIDLGGTQQGVSYDLRKVSSLAQLAGALDVKLVNGFTPTKGETFDFMTYSARSGQYDQVLAFDAGYEYSVSYNDTTGVATLLVSAAGVPEGSTLLSAVLMLGLGGVVMSRRGRLGKTERR